MTNPQQHTARARLVERRRTLASEIHDELVASGEQHFIDLAGQVADAGETSFAHLLADMDAALADRHVHSLRDIDAAIARIDADAYGHCEACGTRIPEARLNAWPEARRCVPCQTREEHDAGFTAAPRL
jgi:RNA polymerase-binding protein DksA